jgi:glyoxylase-like metal-dependent hydrolase (beta-lactamase superfamily II)
MKKNKLITLILLSSFYTATAAQEKESPSMYGVGSFSITVLPEMQQKNNKDILIEATDDMLKKYIPGGTYPAAINAFMVETPDRTILIDAGLGIKLSAHLETCGKKAEDIDIILLTHMHGDHIGGLLHEGKKSFPAAALYVPQPEYDYWMNDDIMSAQPANKQKGFLHAREVLAAYKDSLHLFVPAETGDATNELVTGIRAFAAYGHTPGHTAYLLDSDGQQLLVWGDLTHAMDIQIPCPQVAVTYDENPARAIESRQRILKFVSENKIRIAGMHIEYPGMGDVSGNSTGGYDFTLLCTCEGMFR